MFSYTLGDVIQLRVTLTHEENLESISVVYGKDGNLENTVTFAGEVEGTIQLENYPQESHELPLKESTVTLRMVVDQDHQPGIYSMVHASYDTELDTNQPVADLPAGDPGAPELSFRIVREVMARPRIRLELIDNSTDDPDYRIS